MSGCSSPGLEQTWVTAWEANCFKCHIFRQWDQLQLGLSLEGNYNPILSCHLALLGKKMLWIIHWISLWQVSNKGTKVWTISFLKMCSCNDLHLSFLNGRSYVWYTHSASMNTHSICVPGSQVGKRFGPLYRKWIHCWAQGLAVKFLISVLYISDHFIRAHSCLCDVGFLFLN